MVRLQQEPIRPEVLVEEARCDSSGAVAIFLGTVRDHNAGRRVLYLEYHAYAAMAEAEMARIERDCLARYSVDRVAIAHRTGRLDVGEVSVAIAVASPHRTEAFEACRYAIDTLKRTVPIWKKEFFEGGAVWVEGAG